MKIRIDYYAHPDNGGRQIPFDATSGERVDSGKLVGQRIEAVERDNDQIVLTLAPVPSRLSPVWSAIAIVFFSIGLWSALDGAVTWGRDFLRERAAAERRERIDRWMGHSHDDGCTCRPPDHP